MIEFAYRCTTSDTKIVEKILDDERVAINHIVLAPGESVPTHVSNSYVYQIVVRGDLCLSLEDEECHYHPAGSIVAVPFNKKMSIQNRGTDVLEFFVVKSPNPRDMPAPKAL